MRRGRVAVTHLVNCLGLGGTERQLVELLRRSDPGLVANDLCCLQKTGEFLTPLAAIGVDPLEFPLKGTLLRLNTLRQVRRLAARLHATGAQILHAHDFYSNIVGAAAARLAGIPYIVSRRDLGTWRDGRRMAVLRWVTRSATHVVCNAGAIREQLISGEQLPHSRISLVPNGIDLAAFDAAATQETGDLTPLFDGAAPVVTVVANLKHAVKGHGDLLLAAAAVLRAAPGTRFLLVGDGDLRCDLERRARQLGLGASVTFTGRRTDVPALLARSTVAVSASHSEGLSNALMEAMAARLPIVATAVGGNPELVEDGRTGLLVPPRAPEALARRLVDLLHQPHLGRRMGLAGRRRLEEHYEAARLVERMTSVYEQLVGIGRNERHAA
jgi:glycosyltransferase involved in cell wall biosynthesis